MTHPTKHGAERHVAFAELDGEPVALIPLPHDRTAILDRYAYDEFRRLEISPHVNTRPNSSGLQHVKVAAVLPRPVGGKWPTHQVARLVYALHLLDEEERTGLRAQAGRFRIEFKNGNHLDVRLSNLRATPAGTRSAGFYAVWDLRERRKLVLAGKKPNAEFAARRRAARAAKKAGE